MAGRRERKSEREREREVEDDTKRRLTQTERVIPQESKGELPKQKGEFHLKRSGHSHNERDSSNREMGSLRERVNIRRRQRDAPRENGGLKHTEEECRREKGGTHRDRQGASHKESSDATKQKG